MCNCASNTYLGITVFKLESGILFVFHASHSGPEISCHLCALCASPADIKWHLSSTAAILYYCQLGILMSVLLLL